MTMYICKYIYIRIYILLDWQEDSIASRYNPLYSKQRATNMYILYEIPLIAKGFQYHKPYGCVSKLGTHLGSLRSTGPGDGR